MTTNQIIWLIGGILLALLFGIGIPFVIKDFKKNRDKYVNNSQKIREEEDKILNDMGETTSLHAVVTDMACGVSTVGYQGYKQPRAEKQFIICFRTDAGEQLQIPVSEDIYEGFEIGMSGALTLIDGMLDSFELDDGDAGNEN